MTDENQPEPAPPARNPPTHDRARTPQARRALAEAAARREALDAKARALTRAREIDGRDGPEPVRYDDWEVKGIASDF